MGKHIILVTDPKSLIISITIAEVFFAVVIIFVKLSILSFFTKIFPQRGFHHLVWIMSAIAVAQNVPSIFLTIFQCVPIAAQWDPSLKAHASCVDYQASTVTSGALNIVTDIIMLSMPAPLLWRLQMSESKKRLVSLAFAAGFVACVVDIVRLAQTGALNSADITCEYSPRLCSAYTVTDIVQTPSSAMSSLAA